MFLNAFQEKNKELFLKVCMHAAMSNGDFADEERDMTYAYCREMNIAEQIPEDIGDFDTIAKSLADGSDDVEKNIIVLEILGLIKSDGLYDEKKKEFMTKLCEGLNVKKKT